MLMSGVGKIVSSARSALGAKFEFLTVSHSSAGVNGLRNRIQGSLTGQRKSLFFTGVPDKAVQVFINSYCSNHVREEQKLSDCFTTFKHFCFSKNWAEIF
jgi:hypothetical protein